jgi:hypothetical protein
MGLTVETTLGNGSRVSGFDAQASLHATCFFSPFARNFHLLACTGDARIADGDDVDFLDSLMLGFVSRAAAGLSGLSGKNMEDV